MVNNQLNPNPTTHSASELSRFIQERRSANASYNSILRGAAGMGFDADSARREMYNQSEIERETAMRTHAADLLRAQEEKKRLAQERDRLKQLEELKKKEQSESGLTPDGGGSELSLSQQIIDADENFLNEWDRRQLLLDYEKAINTNDNNKEVQRLQNEINKVFGVKLGYEKKEGLEKAFEDMSNISVADSIEDDDPSDYFGPVGKSIAVGFGKVLDFVNPVSIAGQLGTLAMETGKPVDFNPEDYEPNFEESRQFILSELEKSNANLAQSISSHNDINTQLGYAPNFDPNSRADMEALYSEIVQRNFNVDPELQALSDELDRQRGLDRGYLNNMVRGMLDQRASAAIQGMDSVAEMFVDGGLSGMGAEGLENWADRAGIRDSARRQMMLGDAFNDKGIIESFLDGEIANGFKKFGVEAPNLISQVATLVLTKGKARQAALGWMGVQAGGNYYSQIKRRDDLSASEKFGQSVAIGAAELTLEKFFIGAENIARQGLRKIKSPKAVLTKKRDNLNKALSDLREGRLSITKEAAKGFGAEALEEGLMSVIEQNLETVYDIANGKQTAADAIRGFNPYEFADSLFLGGVMGAGTRGIGGLASNIGHSSVIKKVEEARKGLAEAEERYKSATDPVMKDLLRAAVLEAQEQLYNLHSVADNLYGRMSVEDGDRVIALNQRLSKVRDDINQTKDRKQRELLKNEFKALYKEKSEIEAKYVTKEDIDRIENQTPFSEQERRAAEREAEANKGQYQMQFPDETGKPQTVEERAMAAAEIRAAELLDLADDQQKAQSEQEQAKADEAVQQSETAEQAPEQRAEQAQPQEPTQQQQQPQRAQAQQDAITLEPGQDVSDADFAAATGAGSQVSSTSLSNVRNFMRGAKAALQKTGTKVVFHKTQESFDASYSKASDTNGYYNPSTNEVHLPPTATLKDIREEFAHAILRSIIGPNSQYRTELYNQAKADKRPEVRKEVAAREKEYVKFYTDLFSRQGLTGDALAQAVRAKVEEEVVAGVLREGPKADGVFEAIKLAINKLIARLYGKDFIIRDNDTLSAIANKMYMGTSYGKSSLDVESAAPPTAGTDVVTPALKRTDFLRNETIYYEINTNENKFGERMDGGYNPKQMKVNDYFHFSNWYAKVTGNGTMAGRLRNMYYIKDGKKVPLRPPAPKKNRDGSVKRVDAIESDRIRYHRINTQLGEKRYNENKYWDNVRDSLERVMADFGITSTLSELSDKKLSNGNLTPEGYVEAVGKVSAMIEQKGSNVDTNKVAVTMSGLDANSPDVTFIGQSGYSTRLMGQNDVVTSASQDISIDEFTPASVKAFADANVAEMVLGDGMIGVAFNGDTVSLTMNHIVPTKHRENTLEYAKSVGMPSIYTNEISGGGNVETGASGYTGMGSTTDTIFAVADLKSGKKPPQREAKPIVSPAAGTTENIGTISPALKTVREIATKEKPDVKSGKNKSFVQMGKALVSKVGDKITNTVAEGFKSEVMIADLTDENFMKELDGCEFITVAYDQTGQTVVTIDGVEYKINSGVRGAKSGEIMSHRNDYTRNQTAQALEKAAKAAQARGKKIVVLYTSMEEPGLKSNPFVARAVMKHALKVAEDLGIVDEFLASFSDTINQLSSKGQLGTTFNDHLRFFAYENGAYDEDNESFEIKTKEQYEGFVDAMANPRGEQSQADFEATFNARETVVDAFAKRTFTGASISSNLKSLKAAEFLQKTIATGDIKGFADPTLYGESQTIAKSGDVVALQFVDPSLIVKENGATRMSWRKTNFKDEPKNAFQYTIQGGEGVMLTSHHISLEKWAPEIMKGRKSDAKIGTVAKGKQTGVLTYEPAADTPKNTEQNIGIGPKERKTTEKETTETEGSVMSASLKMDRSNQDRATDGPWELRERSKYQMLKDLVIRKLQDKFREIMVLQEDVEASKGRLDDSENFGLKETLFYGKAANDLELLEKKVEGLKKALRDNNVTAAELGEYMYALHTPERNRIIKERSGVENGSGKTDAEAKAILDSLTEERKQQLEAAANELRGIMQDTRDTLREFGLSTKEDVDNFESQFEHYIPLAGLAKDEQVDGTAYPTGGAGLAVYRSPVKRAKGRKSEAQEVVAQAIAQAALTKIHARKNEALTAMYNMVMNNPNPAVWSISNVAEFGDKATVPVRIDGKKKYIKFTNAHYAQALNGMTVEKTNTFIKILRAPSNWLRRSFTTLDPEFVISNFARDIQSAIFNATADAELDGNGMNAADVRNRIMRSVFPLMKSLIKDARGKDMSPEHRVFYEEFKADGGKTGWAYAKPLEDIAADLNANPDKAVDKVLGTVRKVTGLIEGVNDAVENSIRLSAYIAARENGVSREKAAEFAKNITVNFNKSGEMGQVANAIYLFFNASVQGTARIAKTLTLKPKFDDFGQQRSYAQRITNAQKLAFSLTMFSAMLSAVNQAISDEDEDGELFYNKISDYEKERNLIIMLDGKNYLKIPLPYGYNVFSNLGTAVSEVSMGHREVDDALMFLLSSAFGSFSPISFGQSKDVYGMLEKGLAPTVAKPFIEVANNETFFGSQVYAKQFPGATPKPESQMSFRSPRWMQELFEFLNETTGGSEYASGWLDTNPDKGWYLFEYFLGGAGRFVTRTGEIVRKASNKAFVDNEVDLEFNDAPILRKVYGETSRYYDFDKFEQNSNEVNQLYKEFESTGYNKDRHKGINPLKQHLKNTNKKLKALRAARREARQIEDYAERTVRLQELMEKERLIIMEFNQKYERLRGR